MLKKRSDGVQESIRGDCILAGAGVFEVVEHIKLNTLEFVADKPATIFDKIREALFLNKIKRDKKYIITVKEL